jgi:hypothetical protein
MLLKISFTLQYHKLLLLLFISLGLIGSANAVSSVDEYFTSLCSSESSPDINWKYEELPYWKAVKFIPRTKYLVKRVNPSDTSDNKCQNTKNRTTDRYFNVALNSTNESKLTRYGCYSIKPFDRDSWGPKQECSETWSTYAKTDKAANPKIVKLESVWCLDEMFFFSPNGSFFNFLSFPSSEGKCKTL